MELMETLNKITDDDMDSAARGLRMKKLPDGELEDIIAKHDDIDMFASYVIAAAARRELILRGVRHA